MNGEVAAYQSSNSIFPITLPLRETHVPLFVAAMHIVES
jgi:hypothetical protein